MAIMWDPPVERLSLFPTSAELEWKRWVVQAIIANPDDVPTDSEATEESPDQMKPAA